MICVGEARWKDNLSALISVTFRVDRSRWSNENVPTFSQSKPKMQITPFSQRRLSSHIKRMSLPRSIHRSIESIEIRHSLFCSPPSLPFVQFRFALLQVSSIFSRSADICDNLIIIQRVTTCVRVYKLTNWRYEYLSFAIDFFIESIEKKRILYFRILSLHF